MTARNAKLALSLNLGRQSVCVPAESALDAIALHGLEARNHVFGVAGEQVAIVRQTVGKRRAIIENELFGTRFFALVNRSLERIVFSPKAKNFLLNGRKTWARVYTLARGV